MCTRFTILGERCSGTNYLEKLMLTNFEIELTWNYGHKHFFGFADYNINNDEDNILFIGIVRNPIDWIYSLYQSHHHIPNFPKLFMNFLLDKFYSVYDDKSIIKSDLNYKTNTKYKNIFESRKYKNDYLINIMPTKVKNYILINYEYLRDHTFILLELLKNTFNLKTKLPQYVNIETYKGNGNNPYIKSKNKLTDKHKQIIIDNLDIMQENYLNYII